jgi:hypothetical protein
MNLPQLKTTVFKRKGEMCLTKWIYRQSKHKGSMVGFGTTHDLREPGSIILVRLPSSRYMKKTRHLPHHFLLAKNIAKKPFRPDPSSISAA